ncbi:MAG: hypothetical protein ABJB49_07035 [Nitrospirota bacterium]
MNATKIEVAMSQSLWRLDFAAGRSHCLAVIASLLLLSIPATAQINKAWPKHDPELLTKLYNGDFAHISDDNFGRIDVEAVMTAFRNDAKAGPDKCPLFGEKRSDAESTDAMARYIRYLNTDRQTGTFPSAQFMALSVLDVASKDAAGVFALDPNAMAMAIEIHEHGCKSERVQKMRENLIKLLEQRVAWYAIKDHSKEIGVQKQSIAAVTQQAWQAAVSNDVSLAAQEQALRQIAGLEARGAQLYDCEYGPTNPDSTGSEAVTFWYKDVPIPMADLLKVSRKHPLAKFGDEAVTACPSTLADARQTFTKSRQVGLNRVDQSALPQAEIPLNRVMGNLYPMYQNVKKSWNAYQSTHDPRDQQQAMTGKQQLLSSPFGYETACEKMKLGGQPPNNIHCQIAQQLADEFRDIPNVPSSQADRPGGNCADPFKSRSDPYCKMKR